MLKLMPRQGFQLLNNRRRVSCTENRIARHEHISARLQNLRAICIAPRHEVSPRAAVFIFIVAGRVRLSDRRTRRVQATLSRPGL